MEQNNFGRGPPKDQSYHVKLKSAQRRCHLKYILFLALVAISCSGVEQFEQFWLKTSQRTILSSLVEIRQVVTEKMLFEVFSSFSSGGHFVQQSGTI